MNIKQNEREINEKTKEIPIGESNNSAKVRMRYVLTSKLGVTFATWLG